MDTGAAGEWDLRVEYWDQEVADISHDLTAKGWMLSMHTDDLTAAFTRAMDLEARQARVRIVLMRPDGAAKLLPPPRSQPVVESTPKTLLDKYGPDGVAAVVDSAYVMFIDDAELAPVFYHFSVPEIKAKVKATFALVLGVTGTAKEEAELALGLTPGTGSVSTLRDHIQQVHGGLRLTHRMFVKVCTGFHDSAIAARVSEEDAHAIYETLMSFEDVVVTSV